nr:SCO6880 family protein [Conexibacter sp. DBS9H8]
MAGIIVVIVTVATVGLVPAVGELVLLALGLTSLMVRDRHGRTGIELVGVRVGWWRARSRGTHLYRSGPLGRTPWGTCQLPGLLAQSRLSEAQDSWGRPFALIELPSMGHFSVVLATEPEGASLVDQEQIDIWVARWGDWLAALGDEPGLIAAAVTVETAPDTGRRLRQVVEAKLDPNAPPLAQSVLREVVESAPAGSASIRVWIALVFMAATRGRRRDGDEFARDLAARLPGLTQRLQGTGAGGARPMTAQELCEVVRGAYDPAAARTIEEAHAQGATPTLRWSDVGPAGAEASWGAYRHDGATSVSWMMSAAPRGEVHSSILWKLLAPHREVGRKRVTLVYRVLDPGVAARIVEADKRNADFRVHSATRPSEHSLREQRAALATAQEEARGAGLVDFGVIVTATVEHAAVDQLAAAEATVENLAATARINLRRVYGSQDSAFAAGLPLGLVLARHLKVPQEIRSAL